MLTDPGGEQRSVQSLTIIIPAVYSALGGVLLIATLTRPRSHTQALHVSSTLACLLGSSYLQVLCPCVPKGRSLALSGLQVSFCEMGPQCLPHYKGDKGDSGSTQFSSLFIPHSSPYLAKASCGFKAWMSWRPPEEQALFCESTVLKAAGNDPVLGTGC